MKVKLFDSLLNVTEIFTDASYDTVHSYWGYIVKNDTNPLLTYGPGISSFKGSGDIESLALLKALCYVNKNISSGHVVIHTDYLCLTNIDLPKLCQGIESSRLAQNYLMKRINELCEEVRSKGIILTIQHISAHQLSEGDRTLYNRIIDQYVRRVRRLDHKDIPKHSKITQMINEFLNPGMDRFLNYVSWDSFPEEQASTKEILELLQTERHYLKTVRVGNRKEKNKVRALAPIKKSS